MSFSADYASIYDRIGQSAFSVSLASQLVRWIAPPEHRTAQKRPYRILDLACGTGAAALVFAGAGCEVVAIDQSPAMLEQARHKAERSHVAIQFIEASMQTLCEWPPDRPPLLPDSFDLVICLGESLNYLGSETDLQCVFAAVTRLLQPGSAFCFDIIDQHRLTSPPESDIVLYDDRDYMVYQNLYCEQSRHLLTRRIVWFVREIAQWWRYEEIHSERIWREEELHAAFSNPQGAALHLLARSELPASETGQHLARTMHYTRKEPLPPDKGSLLSIQ